MKLERSIKETHIMNYITFTEPESESARGLIALIVTLFSTGPRGVNHFLS